MRMLHLGLMLLLSMLVFPVVATAQGNSEAAHACEEGGYLNYIDADGNTFKNEGQCTRYAAQGGTLVRKADISLDQAAGSISGTGFTPNSAITSTRVYSPNGQSFTDSLVSTDATGAFVDSGLNFCFDSANTGVQVTITDASGVSVTETFPLTCSSALRVASVDDDDRVGD
jgi:hypothetical protein